MNEPLKYRYLAWLEERIKPETDRSFSELVEILQDREFIWLIPNDDNRVADGLDVRKEFFHRSNALDQACSVIEVLIGLSRRIAFAAGGMPENWAWDLLTNLGLHKMYGHLGRTRRDRIDNILERLIWRTYSSDGNGGFFPLSWPNGDQRSIELWYQMCAYIDEIPEL